MINKVFLIHLITHLILGFTITHNLANAQTIPAFTAYYSAQARGLTVGRGQLSLRHPEIGRYEMELSMQTLGIANLFSPVDTTEIAQGYLRENRVIPSFYERQQAANRSPQQVRLNFDFESNQIDFQIDHRYGFIRETELDNFTAVFDPLSIHLHIMNDLKSGQLNTQYTLIERDKLETYEVTELPSETLATQLGQLHTRRLRQTQPNTSRFMDLWFAPSLDYLLVKLVRTRRGTEQFRLMITENRLPNE